MHDLKRMSYPVVFLFDSSQGAHVHGTSAGGMGGNDPAHGACKEGSGADHADVSADMMASEECALQKFVTELMYILLRVHIGTHTDNHTLHNHHLHQFLIAANR